MALYDMVQQQVASAPGTGAIPLGTAVVADGITYLTLAQAGALDGEVTSYRLKDGAAWEIGRGTISGAATLVSRGLLRSSTGGLIDAHLQTTFSVVPLAEDFVDSFIGGLTAGGAGGTGITQATATQLVCLTERQFTVIAIAAVSGAAVALPQGRPARRFGIKNATLNPIGVFPRPGDSARINTEATDALGAIIQPDGQLWFTGESISQWHV